MADTMDPLAALAALAAAASEAKVIPEAELPIQEPVIAYSSSIPQPIPSAAPRSLHLDTPSVRQCALRHGFVDREDSEPRPTLAKYMASLGKGNFCSARKSKLKPAETSLTAMRRQGQVLTPQLKTISDVSDSESSSNAGRPKRKSAKAARNYLQRVMQNQFGDVREERAKVPASDSSTGNPRKRSLSPTLEDANKKRKESPSKKHTNNGSNKRPSLNVTDDRKPTRARIVSNESSKTSSPQSAEEEENEDGDVDSESDPSENDNIVDVSPVSADLLSEGSRVLIEYRNRLYKATVRKTRIKDEKHEYLIHYDGNKKSNVHWTPISKIHEVLKNEKAPGVKAKTKPKKKTAANPKRTTQTIARETMESADVASSKQETSAQLPSQDTSRRRRSTSQRRASQESHEEDTKATLEESSKESDSTRSRQATVKQSAESDSTRSRQAAVRQSKESDSARSRQAAVKQSKESDSTRSRLAASKQSKESDATRSRQAAAKPSAESDSTRSRLAAVKQRRTSKSSVEDEVKPVSGDASEPEEEEEEEFPAGLDVYVEYRQIFYLATILKKRKRKGATQFHVHYDGYKKASDGWVKESLIHKITSANSRRFNKQRMVIDPPTTKRRAGTKADPPSSKHPASSRKKNDEKVKATTDSEESESFEEDDDKLDMEGMNAGVEFLPGSCVFVHWKNALYLAKMLKRRYRAGETEYYVHYNGFRDSSNAWVKLSNVYEINPQTRKLFEKKDTKQQKSKSVVEALQKAPTRKRPISRSSSTTSKGDFDMGGVPPGVPFLPGSTLFAKVKNSLHLAKMLKKRGDGDRMEYMVQYVNKKRNKDAWVPVSMVYEINPQTKRIFNKQAH